MLKMDRKILWRSILWAVLIGLCVNLGIAFCMDFESLKQVLYKTRIQIIVVPFLCYFIVYGIDSIRIRLVLQQFNTTISWGEAFYNSIIGVLFSNLTPFASGGQPFQIFHLTSIGVDSKQATNAIFSRQVEFLLTSFGIFLLSIPTALKLANSMEIGAGFMYAGLALSFLISLFIFIALIRPDILSRLLLKIQHTKLSKFLGRMFKKENWVEKVHLWATSLREEVAVLWTQKIPIIFLDFLLGFFNLLLQAISLTYVLRELTPLQASLGQILIMFVIINLVVYYIPTPGASGGIEGSYIWVFSGVNNSPASTTIAIFLWRLATYYLHIIVGLTLFFLYRYFKRQKVQQ
jgi:uncharacterized protein (TIRG00374 family)